MGLCCHSLWRAKCEHAAENGAAVETRPGIAESFAPALSGFTSEMHTEVQAAQKENMPPLSQGKQSGLVFCC